MPDQHKFFKLQQIGYKEKPVCGLCLNFTGERGGWGRCSQMTYDHLKHGQTQLGVHAYGGCAAFVRDEEFANYSLQSYAGL